MSKEIEDAEAWVKVCRGQLIAARDTLADLMLREAEKEFGVKKGVRVTWWTGFGRKRRQLTGIVESIDTSMGRCKPWVRAYQLKKDGTPGRQLRRLFTEWEVVDAPGANEDGGDES